MTANETRARAVQLMKSREKKNSYTQGANRIYFFGKPKDGDPGYSDCSSAVREVIKRAAGIDIGANTSAQISNRSRGLIVEMGISEGRKIPTESKLQPGDCIYYKGTPGNVWGVGHVEMYMGAGRLMGHGSGAGPSVHDLKNYSLNRGTGREYLCAIRWILDDKVSYKLGSRALSKGMVASDVGELQTLLLSLDYDLGTFGAARNGVDNVYGAATAAAVAREQKKRGLAVTGDADLSTIAAIIAAAHGQSVPVQTQQVRITGATVNVRSGPGTRYKAVGVVRRNRLYQATGRTEEGWVEIVNSKNANKTGWVSTKYAEIV